MSDRKKKRRRKPVALQWMEYGLFRLIQGILRLLPIFLVRRVGSAFGSIGLAIARSRTNLAIRNVSKAFPEKEEVEIERIVRECWKRFSIETLLYVRAIDAPADDLGREAELVNREYLERAFAQERGLIVYTAHFGAWESAIAVIRSLGRPFAVVARPLDNELLEKLLQRSRRRFDVEMVPKRNAARTLIRRLAKHEGVLVLPDQAVHPREGILVPFLGTPAWTSTAPARLALRFGAPLVGAFCYRREGRVIAELTEPILTDDMEESRGNVELLTSRINEEISKRIRDDPPLWLWMHDRWKNVDETVTGANRAARGAPASPPE
ncbi:MAG: lysophospholipid acyltransferase family protein [Thermoanaerobaculia bacterium]|nr:lysophospholipid acyltransferase family protein [Thermoanaerobaculia bacterium]